MAAKWSIPQLLSQVTESTRDSYIRGDITESQLRENAKIRRRGASPKYKATRKRYFTGEKGRTTQRKYAQTEKGKELRRDWFKRNPEKGAAQSARYRKAALRATPPWVLRNPAYMAEMNALHLYNRIFPGRFEVHHIVPLDKGGLNVPSNLRVVDRFTNRSLGSKMPSQSLLQTETPSKNIFETTKRGRGGGGAFNPKIWNRQGLLASGSIMGRQLHKRKY